MGSDMFSPFVRSPLERVTLRLRPMGHGSCWLSASELVPLPHHPCPRQLILTLP